MHDMAFFLSFLKAMESPIVVRVFPSPKGVGVIEVTITYFPGFFFFRSFNISRDIFALYVPQDSTYFLLIPIDWATSLMDLSWQDFELLVGKYFEKQGYTIRQLAKAGPDDGVDIVAFKDKEKYLVQCKQWRSNQVGVSVVRELLGAIAARGIQLPA